MANTSIKAELRRFSLKHPSLLVRRLLHSGFLALTFLLLRPMDVLGAPMPGQISVDPDQPRWLKYRLAGPHFLAGPGDPEDFLYRGTRLADGTRQGDQDELIDKLIGTGANSIYMQIVRSHGGDGDSTHNPFIGNDPSQGLNAAVLDQWAAWFDTMDRNGIVVFLFFYDDSSRVWNTGDTVGAEERAFVQQIVSRFQHIKHLVWVVAEEYSEAYTATRVSRLAAEIRTADEFDHPIAVHKLVGTDFSEFAEDPNIDQFAIQLEAATPDGIHQLVLQAHQSAQGRYNLNMSESPEWGSGTIARQKSWAAAMGGSYVMAYQMFIGDTPLSDIQDLGRLRTFMESTLLEFLRPRDDLALGSTNYVLASPGTAYIAYSRDASSPIGIQDVPTGTYSVRWFDPIDGDTVVQELNADGTDVLLTKPSAIGAEAAVYLEKSQASVVPTFPSLTWEFREPVELGLDNLLLDELISRVGGSGCISRFGYMARCWGDTTGNFDWASAAKPVMSTMLFFAIYEGTLAGVDDPISSWGWPLSGEDLSMTFSHLANMISGYARSEGPGESWAYNDTAINLYGRTLERVFSSDLDTVARDRLGLLGIEHGSIFGSRGGIGVDASIMDFARIGLLWLNKGSWDGVQLLPAKFFEDYAKAQVPFNLPRTQGAGSDYLGVGSFGGDTDQMGTGPGVYGFNWWFNTSTPAGSLWPDAPTDTFQANGHWGSEVVIVIPSLHLVVSALGNWGDFGDFSLGNPDSQMNQNLKLLVQATGDPPAGPDQIAPSPPRNLTAN